MDIKGKTVIVVGLAKSGLSAAMLLKRLGASVIVSDTKKEEEVTEAIKELREAGEFQFSLGKNPDDLVEGADLIVVSPGVPTDSPFIIKALNSGIEVISEVELAYRYCKAPIIAITGTNGKTTTTALVGEILKASGRRTHVVGNIGVPFTALVEEMAEEDVTVAEVSSFQLETIANFKPKVSMVLNLSEDHLNRHKTMENYIAAKARIFENQDSNDYLILNGDDPLLSTMDEDTDAQVFYFSRKKLLSRGAWVEDDQIVMDLGNLTGGKVGICRIDQVFIPGAHNLENSLAGVLAAGIMGVSPKVIATVLSEFPGVEHRIEKVTVIDGVTFFNDSKGTNPDSSIKAIQAMIGPTVLIAGGYNKDSSFDDFVDAFGNKIKALVLLGETADIIAKTAMDKGFTCIHRAKSIQEATEKAFALSRPGDNVLLSPACASWDMFRDFEERGRVFKEAVRALRR